MSNTQIEHYKTIFEPYQAYEEPSLSIGAKRLLSQLQKYDSRGEFYLLIERSPLSGYVLLNYKRLSDDLDCSVKAVKRYFEELEHFGFVSRCIVRLVEIKKSRGM